MFSSKYRILRLLALVAVVAALGIMSTTLQTHAATTVSTHPNASGGGCTHTNDFDACISENSIKEMVGDAYVHNPPSNGCSVDLIIFDNDTGATSSRHGLGCGTPTSKVFFVGTQPGHHYVCDAQLFDGNHHLVKEQVSPVQIA